MHSMNLTYSYFFKKVFWRFCLLFILFYIVPNDLGYSITDAHYDLDIWDNIIIWIGETFYGWEFDKEQLYKGYDSIFEYCRYIFVFSIAFIGTIIWLFIDQIIKKKYTNTIKLIVQTILRYHVGLTLLDYGLSKILMIQFGTMSIDMMEQPVGDFTGMGLMWTFLSHSKLVVMFSGWLEFIGGVLLLFRRTTFLGSIILIAVLANVVLLNFGYDVTVTLYASLLLCLSIVLISTQLKSFLKYVVLNKQAKADPYLPLVKSKKVRMIFKIVLISVIGYFHVKNYTELYQEYKINRYAWFTNIQKVEKFVMNGDSLNLSEETNPKAWKKISFNGLSYYPESFSITDAEDNSERYKFEIDSIKNIIRYKPYFKEDKKWDTLSYKKIEDRKYIFEGIFNGDTISVISKAKYFEDYKLIRYKGKFLFDE